MPDVAGAIAAIEQRLADNWSTTPIRKENDPVREPPADASEFVLIEVSVTQSTLRAVGEPGDQFWLYEGVVDVHVFTPVGSGADVGRSHAALIGEIFRNAVFYNSVPDYQVRTLSPRIDGGGKGSEDGNWFRVTMTCPFEYFHRG